MEATRFNVSCKVIGVLTAYLIKYLPQVKALAHTRLYVVRVEECLDAAGIAVTEMLAWSSALNDVASMPVHESKIEEERTKYCKSGDLHLTNQLGKKQKNKKSQFKNNLPSEEKRRYQPLLHYTRMPRIWDSSDRQKKSDYRLVVAYTKMFPDDGFLLHEGAEDFLEIGLRAESAVLAFLSGHGIRAKDGSSVLREMSKLHRVGKLNDRILAYRSRLAVEKIVDPAPVGTENILQIVGHV
ncbi:hypothetical protein PHMEG_00017695 [Phytophthora megakarya]|uniref:Uncharacterized protein n=1 Tax=Phytophthora megakarya TaxID=4795 RepID=A0A225VXF2_9STRA|nr:hypothetical protein PHMEG_00017695 [Phytophthora megakarya]